ncbi:hypothetical protein [Actinotalea sp. K2]|uniref:hypothetical protein n=1 Tax=Actinotalea sp. K2 TaxID=2939438 RepID=UPI002017F2D6|nr:hypothetical protein [Actinotalea sp. K2]MCL3860793.1 hypothetical protein [Actinotalea sp. K2]
MGFTPTKRTVAVEGVLLGSFSLLWYAMPDVVRSRGLRGVLKSAMVVGYGAYAAATRPSTSDEEPHDRAATPGGSDTLRAVADLTSTPPVLDAAELDLAIDSAGSPGRSVALASGVAAFVVGSVAGTIAIERAIYGLGERRRDRGVRAAHTRIGIVAGLGGVLVGAVSTELDRRSALAAEAARTG